MLHVFPPGDSYNISWRSSDPKVKAIIPLGGNMLQYKLGTYISLSLSLSLFLFKHIYLYIHVHNIVSMYVCRYVRTYVRMYVCVCFAFLQTSLLHLPPFRIRDFVRERSAGNLMPKEDTMGALMANLLNYNRFI